MKELFTIDVILDGTHTLKSAAGQVNMVLFHGSCDCEFFHGAILSGGVDTQKYLTGEAGLLSARYMLDGVDDAGVPTRIFIENNGMNDENGEMVTHPVILTDNARLSWLEKAALTGRITGTPRGVMIHFCTEEAAT